MTVGEKKGDNDTFRTLLLHKPIRSYVYPPSPLPTWESDPNEQVTFPVFGYI